MPKNKERDIVEMKGGVFNELSNYFKLILRLMGDRRVPIYLKLIPIGSLVYFLFPDLFIGPIDDAVVIWMTTYLFIELCPPEVVQEHRDALNRLDAGQGSQSKTTRDPLKGEDDIIDAEFWDKSKS